MKILHSVHPHDFRSYTTESIRKQFLLDGLITAGRLNLVYTHYDRMIIGGAMPLEQKLDLENYPELRANFFLERREIGIINVAGAGTIIAGGNNYQLNKLDCLYLGKGVQDVSFSSAEPGNPAVYYILSAPAHAVYPAALVTNQQAAKVNTGETSTANKRIINKYIYADGIKSCQLVMGLTILQEGSVWNTMPPHVHDRRMEAYFYFDLPAGQRVIHFMGQPDETRHITVSNYEAVVSPPWSIHSGSGTANYSFIWGMAGENMDYTDMDAVDIKDIK